MMTPAEYRRRRAGLRQRFELGELGQAEYRLLVRGLAAAYELERPARRRARRKVRTEREAGRLQRPGACERCGQEGRVEAHHEDHGRPLSFAWLCARCHDAADRELAAARFD